MWLPRIHRRISIICDTRAGSCPWLVCSRAIKSPAANRFLKTSDKLPPSESFGSKFVDGRVRNIPSLGALRVLCDKTSSPERAISISELSIVGQLYVLRVINSSGVLWQPLDSCILEEVQFAQEAIWQLITSIECFLNTGDVTTLRSKHVVGLVWHLVKLANHLSKAIDPKLVDPQVVKQADTSSVPIVITSTDRQSELDAIRLLLLCRLLNLVTGVLRRLQESAVKLNGKDLQQILMFACEDLFVSMPRNSCRRAKRRGYAPDCHPDVVAARRDALRGIEELATSCIHILNDSEITCVYVSCFSKDVSQSLMILLSRGIAERSTKGYLNVTMPQCITLLSFSKSHYVPKIAVQVLLSQLESCPFRKLHDVDFNPDEPEQYTSIPETPRVAYPIPDDTVDWRSSFRNATMTDIGRLCKSLYHLKCSHKLLDNFDQRLSSLLNSAYLYNRLRSRSNSDRSVLNNTVMTLSSIVHLFAKNGYNECYSMDRLIEVTHKIPWDTNNTNEAVILGDLCWSLLTLKVDICLLFNHLNRFISRLPYLPMKHTVKLLGGFYNSLSNSPFREDPEPRYSTGRETMDDMLAYTLQCTTVSSAPVENTDPSSSLCNMRDLRGGYEAQNYMQRARQHFMNRVQEVDDVQCISNFMFYIVSTLNNMTDTEYSILCSRWLDLSNEQTSKVKVESLTQVLWSLQRNRIYHEAFLIRVRQLVSEQIALCSMGQLALVSHTLSSFNLQDADFIRSLLKRTETLAKENERLCKTNDTGSSRDMWDIKLVSVIWSVIITDFTTLNIAIIHSLLSLLRHIDWEVFLMNSKLQDLRKILQIHTSFSVELSAGNYQIDDCPPTFLIPNSVMSAATKASQAFTNSNILSVSQDKARRSLSSFGVNYKGEYEIYNGIRVDFALSRKGPSESFQPDLVIEMDGPHHYNVVCDGCSASYQQIGALRMLPSGKTMYRNRILKKLGYKLETINWVEAHRRPVHYTLVDILRRNNYAVSLKQK